MSDRPVRPVKFPEAKFVRTNGIRMAVHEQGEGEPVVLLHGFPELAFSWRHQLPALAVAGYRAIAPDQRGYGLTDVPTQVSEYGVDKLIADVLGLLDALELESATFVGHDWGALVLWHMAMLAPERMNGLIQLNIPHFPRSPMDPVAIFRQRFGDDFYIVNFQDSDAADRLFARDPAHFINMLMRKNQLTRKAYEQLPPQHQVISLISTAERETASGDPLLDEDELLYYASAFSKTGFSGAINWYRNWTANWEAMAGVEQVIEVPTLFIGASDDVIISPEHIEAMKPLVRNLEIHVLEGCGHWSQQERPEDVNRLMIDWLSRSAV